MAETDDPGESGFIYTLSDIAKNIQICKKTFNNWKWDLVKKKQGREYLFEKESLYNAISDYSYKCLGWKVLSCKYDRLPEYYTEKQCAEMLGLKDGRQFRRNIIDNPNMMCRFEGVEILRVGSTVRIEKESFELYLEWLKDEDRGIPEYLTFTECAEMLGITPRKFKRDFIEKKKFSGVKYLKIGSIIRIYKKSFLKCLEQSGIEYKTMEFLEIEQCAEMLGITRGQFNKNYIRTKKLKSEGVKFRLRFKQIEKESFLRFLEKTGGETTK